MEVPGNAPDARHIYERLGFKEVYTPPEMKEDDPIWGGLTNMRLDLNAQHGELAHYGVKGMKWGVRKDRQTAKNKRNANYTKEQRNRDHNEFGRAGVKRINQRMNKGMGVKKARAKERTLRRRRTAAVTTTIAAVRYRKDIMDVLQLVGGFAMQSVALRAETKRGQNAAANAMGLPRTASAGPSYVKQKRSGAYNITSL